MIILQIIGTLLVYNKLLVMNGQFERMATKKASKMRQEENASTKIFITNYRFFIYFSMLF